MAQIEEIYKISGMSCGSCVAKVQDALSNVPDVTNVVVDKETDTAKLVSESKVTLSALADALQKKDSKYGISIASAGQADSQRSWLETYKPLLIILFYLLLVTGTIQYGNGAFDMMTWMRHFMGGFFLVFSFFKLLDLTGFANSYMTYDIIAKWWRGWGYVYAFIELGLGVAYLTNCCPLATNITAFLVMSLSIIGVIMSVMNKRKIQCACLGAVFDLPMSTVTIIEDALMILMSGAMIWSLL